MLGDSGVGYGSRDKCNSGKCSINILGYERARDSGFYGGDLDGSSGGRKRKQKKPPKKINFSGYGSTLDKSSGSIFISQTRNSVFPKSP